MTILKSVLRFAAPVALLAVSACAQNFNARVNRFQAMPAPQGQSYFVKAGDTKLAGGLEFSTYASRVGQKLSALGYQAAPSPDAASFVVTLAYGIDEGKEKIRSVPGMSGCYGYYDPWCRGGFGYYGMGFGYGSRGYYGSPHNWRGGGYAFGYYDPFLFGSGFGDEVERYTVFTSDLNMKIEKNGTGERLFEGNAKALSLNDNMTYLVPNLIEAMFTGFPGNSGETVRITVAPQKKGG
jgi:Domain of unknown function (DUF4136)